MTKITRTLGVFVCLILSGCDFNAPSRSDLEYMMQNLPDSVDPSVKVHDESCTSVGNGLYKCEFTYDKRFYELNLMSGATPGMYSSKISAVVEKQTDRWHIVSDYRMLDRHKIGE